jgi:hypothetical protein
LATAEWARPTCSPAIPSGAPASSEGHTLAALDHPNIGQIDRFEPEDQASRVQTYDTVDGQRFVVVRTPRPPEAGIAVVMNWFQQFERR